METKQEVLVSMGAPADVLGIIATQLGMLSYATLEDEEAVREAVEHFARALELDPGQEEARTRLETLLASAEHRGRIAGLLEPTYRAEERWEEVAATTEIRLEALRDDGASGPDSRACLGDLIKLYGEQLESPEREWHARGRLVEAEPDDSENREIFEALSDALDRWASLIEVYQHAAEESHVPATRVALLRAVARTHHHRLDDLEQARSIYHLVLDEIGEDEEALDALEAIYEERNEPEELLEICQRQLVLAQGTDARLDRTLQISDLLAHELDRLDEAISAARDALAIRPDHDPTIQRLDELYTRTERWTELVALLEDQSSACAEDRERHAIMLLRLGSVHEERIEDPGAAIILYGR
ncbi:MAG: hypothetical protein VX938_02880, partial [Myxococcota bacterium]|nr:hypothetical protein [Myxococcota bacterium]